LFFLSTDCKNDSYSLPNLNSKPSSQKEVSLSNFENKRKALRSFGLLFVNRDFDLDFSRSLPPIHGLLISEIVIIESQSQYNPEAYFTSGGFRGDSVMVETITKGTIMRPLRETLINIPLRYNYHIVRRGHFGLDASLGLIMNLSRQQLGPVLNSNNEWTIVSGQSQNRLGLSYDLSLSAKYTLEK